jgi:hypothetical protein
MKMTLSIPRTISNKVNVASEAQPSAVAIHANQSANSLSPRDAALPRSIALVACLVGAGQAATGHQTHKYVTRSRASGREGIR